LGKLELGRELIEKSIRIDDKNALAYQNLGRYFELKGDKAKANEYFEKAKL
jgi:Tfp pilus assembly protein PilF